MAFQYKSVIKNETINDNIFKKLIENKRVVIVGPADYVNNSTLIDSYDVIVRVNKGLNMETSGNSGSRTDILYHTVNIHPENGGPLTLQKNLHIRFAYPPIAKGENNSFKVLGNHTDYITIEKLYPSLSNFSIVSKEKYINFEKQCDSRPNTGVIAILDILSYNIKELYITGFTLFQTDYCKTYREKVDGNTDTGKHALLRMAKAGNHNQQKTASVFKNCIITNSKVKYDQELINVLDKL